MNQKIWTAFDEHTNGLFLGDDPILEQALQDSDAAELPQIAVAPNQGKLIMMLAQMIGAKRILEVGTLGGYSTLWLARALPENGKLISLELEPHHAEVALKNVARAGLGDKVDIRVGSALDSLKILVEENVKPFDLIFLDADKPGNPDYFEQSLKLSHSGTIIIADNVVRGGEVMNAGSHDESVQGIRRLNNMIAADPRVDATAIQTVGSKGYDGFALIRVL